ncbi:MAG: spondin domain-containing protein [Sandaracinaceae bacterium]|nr:spondin domain-containing protein [Sandaracinaceae bacterium]
MANWAVNRAGVLDRGITLGPAGTERFGMAQPGDRFEITVRADAAHPRLSVATAIPYANDAFLAFPGQGIRLLGEDGRVRAAADLEREILRALTVWDAGTEANEVPGAEVHAGARAGEPNFGAPDPDARVRRYDDATNDLDEDGVGEVLDLRIRNTGGSTFEVTVANTSGDTPFPLLVTPFAYAVHEEGVRLFEPGGPPRPASRSSRRTASRA